MTTTSPSSVPVIVLRMPAQPVLDLVCLEARAEDPRNAVFVDAFGRVEVKPWKK